MGAVMKLDRETNLPKLAGCGKNFERLQVIACKDIFINGNCIRILGIHFMDYGLDWNVKKHKHSFFEFHYVTENNVFTTINDVEYYIRPGQFYIMPPGTFHSHRQDPGTWHIGFALRWEVIKEGKLCGSCSNYSYDFEKVHECLSNAPSYPVTDSGSVLRGMVSILEKTEWGSGLLELQLMFIQLIMDIARSYSTRISDVHFNVNDSFLESQIVNNAIRFIEENYIQEIGVEDISNSIHMSYSHLSRLFKNHTGETLTHYLNKIRLARAQRLLKCSDKSIGQVARETGFSSEYYFCTIFKKFHSISPGNYRSSKGALSE